MMIMRRIPEERSHFKTKPFAGSGFNTVYQKPVLSDDVFDKPRNNWEAAEQAVKRKITGKCQQRKQLSKRQQFLLTKHLLWKQQQ